MHSDNQQSSQSLLQFEERGQQELSITCSSYNMKERLESQALQKAGFEILPSNLLFYSPQQLNQCLIQAVRDGELINVKKILKHFQCSSKPPSLIELIDQNSNTLVHLAIQSDSLRILSLLTDYEPKLDWFGSENLDQLLPVHIASFKGSLQILEKLKVLGVNLSEQNTLGRNAISFASQANQVAAIVWLRMQNVDYLEQDKKLSTPLHWAAYYGCENTMALLLNWVLKDKRKDVINFKDDEGMTALHLSVMAGTGNIVSMLLQRGADKHIENNQGVTPLDLIKESSSPQMKSFQLVHHWYKPCQSSVKKEKVIQGARHLIEKKFKEVKKNYTQLLMVCILYSYCGFGTVLCSTSKQLWAFELSIILILLNLAMYVAAVAKDPGYFQIGNDNEKLLSLFMSQSPTEVCSYCILLKPKRTRHCETCRRCVKVYDRHCTWMNNCVKLRDLLPIQIGASNQVFFTALLATLLISSITFVGLNGFFLGDQEVQRDLLKPQKNADAGQGLFILKIQITVIIICAVASVPLSYMMFQQISNLLMDKTAYEKSKEEQEQCSRRSLYNCYKACFKNKNDPQYS